MRSAVVLGEQLVDARRDQRARARRRTARDRAPDSPTAAPRGWCGSAARPSRSRRGTAAPASGDRATRRRSAGRPTATGRAAPGTRAAPRAGGARATARSDIASRGIASMRASRSSHARCVSAHASTSCAPAHPCRARHNAAERAMLPIERAAMIGVARRRPRHVADERRATRRARPAAPRRSTAARARTASRRTATDCRARSAPAARAARR